MLKYLKNIIHLVKNFGGIFDISPSPVKSLGGYTPSISYSRIYSLVRNTISARLYCKNHSLTFTVL